MMAIIQELAAKVLCALGVPALARWRRSHRLAILMFHGVEPEPLSSPCDWITDVSTLRRQLEYVRRHFEVLPLEVALERLRDGTLPKHAAAVTFDDGTRNLLTNAAPVLRELHMPAAVFLATGPMGTTELLWPDRIWSAYQQTAVPEADLTSVGLGVRSLRTEAERIRARDATMDALKRVSDADRIEDVEAVVAALGPEPDVDSGPFQLLSRDEARALAEDGLVTVYPHTVTHPVLSRCDDEKVDYEVSESCQAVEAIAGREPTIFAYPNGRAPDFTDRDKEALRRYGIRWAVTTVNGFADRRSDPLALPRIAFAPDQSTSMFKLKVSGFDPRRPATAAGTGAAREGIGSGVGV
jgi:peptidoglycan/xylan/chitin deacetylase (PgdA/CDA1 family)